MLVEFDTGLGGVLEASWGLPGHHCDLGFDLVCERGGLRFSWERSNEVEVLEGDVHDPSNGHRRVLIGAGQPDVARFVSVPGQAMGYRDAFTIGVGRVMTAIGRGEEQVAPTFRDGLAAALVVDAAQVSAIERAWVDVPRATPT
jgi:predicted dehydrogenase